MTCQRKNEGLAELVEIKVKMTKRMLDEIDEAVARSYLGFKGRDDFVQLAVSYYLEMISFSVVRT